MVKKYFRRGGTWQYSHNNATLSNYTTVNVGFLLLVVIPQCFLNFVHCFIPP